MGKLTKDTQTSSKGKFGDEKQMVSKERNKNLAQIINNKRPAFNRYLSQKTEADNTEYNR
jgi:hypothetical protein